MAVMENIVTFLPVILALVASAAMAYAAFLRKRLARAEKQREEAVKFLSHFNHAIRTPLTTLAGVAEILEGDDRLDEGQRKIVKTLRTSTQSLKDLTATIPDFSTGNGGEVK